MVVVTWPLQSGSREQIGSQDIKPQVLPLMIHFLYQGSIFQRCHNLPKQGHDLGISCSNRRGCGDILNQSAFPEVTVCVLKLHFTNWSTTFGAYLQLLTWHTPFCVIIPPPPIWEDDGWTTVWKLEMKWSVVALQFISRVRFLQRPEKRVWILASLTSLIWVFLGMSSCWALAHRQEESSRGCLKHPWKWPQLWKELRKSTG